jgi:hypothetical protein
MPPVASLPLHAPLAMHDVAYVEDHVSVASWVSGTVEGLSDIETVGAGELEEELLPP